MKYYRLVTDDDAFPDRWFLDEPVGRDGEQLDARDFRYGTAYDLSIPAAVPIQYPGRTVAFNLAAFDMPVVTTEIGQLIEDLAPAEIQRFPVRIGSATPGYEILNVVCRQDCVDEHRSEVMKWGENDGRPEKIGTYRMVTELTIDPDRVDGHHIFRIKDWEIALIVSDTIRTQLEGIENLGVKFETV